MYNSTSIWAENSTSRKINHQNHPNFRHTFSATKTNTRHWQLILRKLGFYFRSGISLDIYVIFLCRISYDDQLKIKPTKKLKEIPSRHFLENLPEKTSMYAFIHLKLICNLQGFCQYIMTDMLNRTIANYRKFSGIAFLGP